MRTIALVLLLLISPILRAGTVNLSGVKNDSLLGNDILLHFEDSAAQLSFFQVQKIQFSQDTVDVKVIQNTKSNYWSKFFIQSDSSKKWVLEIISPHTQWITFYYPKKDGTYGEMITGHLHEFSKRPYQHKNFVFDLMPEWDYSKAIYIKINSENKVALLYKIRTQTYFTQYSLNEYLLLGFYYGILCLLIIYNLVLYFSIRDKVYLFYSFTVLCAVFISLSDDGLGFAYLWYNYPQWSQNLGLYVFPIGFLLCYSLYAYYYLSSDKWLKNIIFYVSGGYILYIFISLFFANEKLYFSKGYLLPFITIYVVYCWYYVRYKYHPALFFIVGNSFALLGIVINQLRLLNIIPGNTFTVYAFDGGFLLEFVSLSLSLSYKYKREIIEKQEAQKKELASQKRTNLSQQVLIKTIKEKNTLANKVNEELENLVSERTNELNNLVKKLKDLNIDYDKENWDLKRVIQDEKQSKFMNETLSLKEFQQLYPTKIRCLQYLSDIKWKDSYACKSCAYDKFSVNPENLNRKCSKCGKIHSVTESSLYHAQKAPLNKLFYLTYLINKDGQLDVPDISQKLDISINSIYKFQKKVLDKKALLKGKNNNWINLIY